MGIREAREEDLATVPGITRELASVIKSELKRAERQIREVVTAIR